MDGLYSLRRADRSVRLAAALFLIVTGAAYVFAFLMVRTYAGLTPADIAATYAPLRSVDAASLPGRSSSETESLDLSSMAAEAHRVDTNLLIQDSHVHLLLYAIIAALETLVVLGLDWRSWWRETVITAAFLAGLLDFAGQWLMKAGVPAFAWLTIASGWTMAAVYVVVVVGTTVELRAAASRSQSQRRS